MQSASYGKIMIRDLDKILDSYDRSLPVTQKMVSVFNPKAEISALKSAVEAIKKRLGGADKEITRDDLVLLSIILQKNYDKAKINPAIKKVFDEVNQLLITQHSMLGIGAVTQDYLLKGSHIDAIKNPNDPNHAEAEKQIKNILDAHLIAKESNLSTFNPSTKGNPLELFQWISFLDKFKKENMLNSDNVALFETLRGQGVNMKGVMGILDFFSSRRDLDMPGLLEDFRRIGVHIAEHRRIRPSEDRFNNFVDNDGDLLNSTARITGFSREGAVHGATLLRVMFYDLARRNHVERWDMKSEIANFKSNQMDLFSLVSQCVVPGSSLRYKGIILAKDQEIISQLYNFLQDRHINVSEIKQITETKYGCQLFHSFASRIRPEDLRAETVIQWKNIFQQFIDNYTNAENVGGVNPLTLEQQNELELRFRNIFEAAQRQVDGLINRLNNPNPAVMQPQNQVNYGQSTHNEAVHQSVSESVQNLKKKYGRLIDTSEKLKAIHDEITHWATNINAVDSLNLNHVPSGSIRILIQDVPAASKMVAAKRALEARNLLNNTYVDARSGIRMGEMLALFWVAIHDPEMRKVSFTKDQEILSESEKLKIATAFVEDLFADALYQTQREYLFVNEPIGSDRFYEIGGSDIIGAACAGGTFNKFSEIFSTILPSMVEIRFEQIKVAEFRLPYAVIDSFILYLKEEAEKKKDQPEDYNKWLDQLKDQIENGEEGFGKIWYAVIKEKTKAMMQSEFKATPITDKLIENGEYAPTDKILAAIGEARMMPKVAGNPSVLYSGQNAALNQARKEREERGDKKGLSK